MLVYFLTDNGRKSQEKIRKQRLYHFIYTWGKYCFHFGSGVGQLDSREEGVNFNSVGLYSDL